MTNDKQRVPVTESRTTQKCEFTDYGKLYK